MGTLLDVTERRLAEEALKASEEKYRTIFSAINEGIVVIDPADGRFPGGQPEIPGDGGYGMEEAGELSLAKCAAPIPRSRFRRPRN